MLRFQSFLSSSSGNCTFITDGQTNILVDCGANGKYITDCLKRINIAPENIDAIFVTHEHRDHIAGVGVFSRKYHTAVYASDGTWEGMSPGIGKIESSNIKIIKSGKNITLGKLKIKPFSIPHDAKGAQGFRFTNENKSFAIATDTGHITDELAESLSGCDSVIVEANHDIEMLKSGRYPYFLKRRIMSSVGHLSNNDCAVLCSMLAKTGTKSFWLGHLSKENNKPDLAYKCVKEGLLNAEAPPDVCVNVLPPNWI